MTRDLPCETYLYDFNPITCLLSLTVNRDTQLVPHAEKTHLQQFTTRITVTIGVSIPLGRPRLLYYRRHNIETELSITPIKAYTPQPRRFSSLDYSPFPLTRTSARCQPAAEVRHRSSTVGDQLTRFHRACRNITRRTPFSNQSTVCPGATRAISPWPSHSPWLQFCPCMVRQVESRAV